MNNSIIDAQLNFNHAVNRIARICHEVNRAYCLSQSDTSQVEWEKAPEWQKQSARNGVIYHLTNDNTTPADSHKSWMKEKLENGWMYGPVKDAKLKTHPCMIPFEELPKDQQAKDYIFHAIVISQKVKIQD